MLNRALSVLSVILACSVACSGDGKSSSSGTDGTTSTTSGSTTDGSTSTGTSESDTGSSDEGTTGGGSCGTSVFVNFDGPTMQLGNDDARTDTTSMDYFEGDLEPYAGSVSPASVISELEQIFAPFDICFTHDRPAEGWYTMVVVTSTNPVGPTVWGVSPLDCENTNANNVAFVMPNGAWDVDAKAIANVVASEFAITIGLESVEEDGDIMCRFDCSNPPNVDREFTDTCLALGMGGNMCSAQHEANCGSNQQNSYQEMATLIGLSG